MTYQQTQQTNGALHTPTSLVPFRELANQIYDMRMKLGLNQIEMGKLLDVSGPTISMWERGNPPHGPNLEMLRKFIADNQEQVMGTKEPRQETITFVDPDAPKLFVLHRPDDVPLRFTGFKLGSRLFGDSWLHLYRTKKELVIWECDGFVNYGPVDHFVKNWQHSADSGDVFSFANECGLEIFEDIE